MTYSTPPAAAGLAVAPHSAPVSSGRTARLDGRSQRVMPLMRKVEIAHLSPSRPNDILEISRIVPAVSVFEDQFSAFAKGSIIQTDRGHVPVEDLYPGDMIKTADAGYQPLAWRGMTVLSARAKGQDPAMGTLTRISADALGMGRPSPDLILGPRARLAHQAPGVKTLTGADAAFIPVRDFIDGVNIVELTPPTTVNSFHLGFERQHRIMANGVEVESMHPGPSHLIQLRGDMLQLFLSCFPHMQSLESFGPTALPRLKLQDLDIFDAA